MGHLSVSKVKAVDQLNVRQNFTDLKLIYTVTGEWGKLAQQWHGLILICQNQSWWGETVVLVTKFKILIINVQKLQDCTVFASTDWLDTVLLYMWCDFFNLLMPELNPSTQHCLARFFTGDFVSWTMHFVNILLKNQQTQQLFSQFINYVW
jgi:hypothetical protein